MPVGKVATPATGRNASVDVLRFLGRAVDLSGVFAPGLVIDNIRDLVHGAFDLVSVILSDVLGLLLQLVQETHRSSFQSGKSLPVQYDGRAEHRGAITCVYRCRGYAAIRL
jgi:hypothetical protein